MDRLDAMALFVAAVDEGSLAAAARRGGRSPATITRAVALLEALAGETLLLRSTRQLRLTAAGDRHVAIWRDVLAQLSEIGPSRASGPLKGAFVLTAPELFGRLKVVPILEPLLRAQPLISARVLLLNRLVDLVGEGVDIAIRLALLPDSAMTAIGLGEVRILTCASPEYLDRAGFPRDPQDLGDHDCIGLNAGGDGELWRFRPANGTSGRLRSVRVRTRLSLNNAGAAIDAAIRGFGLVQARDYQVAEAVAEGRLVPVLAAFEPPPAPAHLVFHPASAKRAPVRTVIEHVVPTLRSELRRIASAMTA